VRSVSAEPDALLRIAALRDRSLVLAEECGETMRYRLLESVREYARERLTAAEWEGLVHWHTAYYLALAAAAERQLSGPQQRRWLERLKADEANLQAALERAAQSEEGLRLAATLCPFWQLRGQWREGGQWLERTLSANPGAPAALRARALFGAAGLAYLAGDPARGESLCGAGLLLCDRGANTDAAAEAIRPLLTPDLLLCFGDSSRGQPRLQEALERGGQEPRVQALLIAAEAKQARFRGHYAEAAALHDRSLAIYRQLGDQRGTAALLRLRGAVLFYQGEHAAARRCWEESLAFYRELDDQAGISALTADLGYAALHLGEHERGERLVDEALSMSRRLGARGGIASALWLLGNLAYCRQQYDRAAELLEESLEIRRAIGDASAIADTLVTLGLMAEVRGDFTRARTVLGEAIALRRRGTDKLDLAEALIRLGSALLRERRSLDEAEPLLQESLALSRQMRNDPLVAHSLYGLGCVASHRGDFGNAEVRLRESLAIAYRLSSQQSMAEGLEALSELRLRQHRTAEAAALYATAEAIREASHSPLPACARAQHACALASLRAALGTERFAAIWEKARGRNPDDMLLDVLERVS
jgi:tetratricopeptide (TPR) repeat protein